MKQIECILIYFYKCSSLLCSHCSVYLHLLNRCYSQDTDSW